MTQETPDFDVLAAAYARAHGETRLSTEKCVFLDANRPCCQHEYPSQQLGAGCTEYLLAELLREMRVLRAALLAYLPPGRDNV